MKGDMFMVKKVVIAGCRDYNNYEEAKAFIDAGADALGASAGIAIAEGEPK